MNLKKAEQTPYTRNLGTWSIPLYPRTILKADYIVHTLSTRDVISEAPWKVIVKVKVVWLCPALCNSMDYSPWNSPGQNTGVGILSLLHGIFPTQGSNPGLPHSRWIRYQLSHKASPGILKWVAYPFSRGSFQSRNRTQVSHIGGGFFTSWDTREAQEY